MLILILCAVKVAWSQNYGLSENISFNASDLTFSDVMKGFEMRTGTRIQYDAQLVSENRRFQIAYNNVRARQAMKDFLNAQGLDFNENGNELILHKRSAVQAQMYHVITGRVVSAGAGEHIAGAQIVYGNPSRTVIPPMPDFLNCL